MANRSTGFVRQSNRLFETRKAQGLCYKCGEKYHPGHQCKHKQLNDMSASMEPPEGETNTKFEDIGAQVKEIMDEEISLNSLSGTEVPNTITLKEESKKNTITILLNSGSTYSFLDLETSKKRGCVIRETASMRVTVANRNHLCNLYTCPKFK